jgi:hypothetical protein
VSSDSEILEAVRAAFGGCPRPEHFTDYRHCEECREHDDLLRSRDPESLRIGDVDNPGWDPLCYISPEGFAYYMPALARLALDGSDADPGWYGPQLAFHLTYEGEDNRHRQSFSPPQRRAVAGLLAHLLETRVELAEENFCADELTQAIGLWSESGTG